MLQLGERLDVVAAVPQNAGVTVDERDRRFGRAGVHVAVIERDQPGLRAQLRDVDRALVLGAPDHGQLDLLAVPDQLGGRFSHWGLLALADHDMESTDILIGIERKGVPNSRELSYGLRPLRRPARAP